MRVGATRWSAPGRRFQQGADMESTVHGAFREFIAARSTALIVAGAKGSTFASRTPSVCAAGGPEVCEDRTVKVAEVPDARVPVQREPA